jgi:hypothetical protein
MRRNKKHRNRCHPHKPPELELSLQAQIHEVDEQLPHLSIDGEDARYNWAHEWELQKLYGETVAPVRRRARRRLDAALVG